MMANHPENMASVGQLPSVATWTFGDSREVSEGLRSFPISVDGKWLTVQILAAQAPFELSSLNEGSSRKTMVLRLPKGWDEPFGTMEAALVKEAAANSQALFGERLSEEQLIERYKSITQKTGEFPRNVRAKVNLGAGPYATRYWDMARAAVPAPGLYAGKSYNAVLTIRSLWVSNDAWGLVCDATDLQIMESPPVDCPFACI